MRVETPAHFLLCEIGCPSYLENAEKDVITPLNETPGCISWVVYNQIEAYF